VLFYPAEEQFNSPVKTIEIGAAVCASSAVTAFAAAMILLLAFFLR
jgi:hypothetical protein